MVLFKNEGIPSLFRLTHENIYAQHCVSLFPKYIHECYVSVNDLHLHILQCVNLPFIVICTILHDNLSHMFCSQFYLT
jgi:hypothetical protein